MDLDIFEVRSDRARRTTARRANGQAYSKIASASVYFTPEAASRIGPAIRRADTV